MLHGQRVLARANADGSWAAEGTHVEVRYGRDSGRAYRARVSNLVREENAHILPDDACTPVKPVPPRSKQSSSRSATSGRSRPSAKHGGGRIQHAVLTQGPAETSSTAADGIEVYADGACSGNPGPAGLGVVILDGAARTEISEYLGAGTNNIAELTAIDRALGSLPDAARATVIHTDSSYAIGVLSKGWKAKANTDLVGRLRARLAERPATRLVYVPGHSGVPLNERADELAREAVRTGRTRTERTETGPSKSQ